MNVLKYILLSILKGRLITEIELKVFNISISDQGVRNKFQRVGLTPCHFPTVSPID